MVDSHSLVTALHSSVGKLQEFQSESSAFGTGLYGVSSLWQ